MTNALAVSDIVKTSVSLSSIAAAVRNFGSVLVLGSSNVIDTRERIRSYTTLAGVAADFGTAVAEYLAAVAFFAQNPQPAQLYIGKWAYAATAGLLHGGALSAAEQLTTAWTGITTGAVKFTIDGVLRSLTALDFHLITNMNGVAAVINTALGANGTCTWNSVYNRFEVVSATTGAASTVSYATAGAGGGVDISAQVRGTAATGALAPVDGIVAETALAAVGILAGNSNQWYGLNLASLSAVDADHLAIAAYIEASSPQRVYGVNTQDANTLVASATTDLAYQLSALNYNRTFTQYSSSSPNAVMSLFGRAATVDFTGTNTTITLKFKNEPGIAAETLTETQAAAIKGKHCNVFAAYTDAASILQEGVMASGAYIDEIYGTDWLQNSVQIDVFNYLHDSPTKIPQTDAGTSGIAAIVAKSLEKGVANGLLGAGVWSGPAIGGLATGQTLAQGYYVYAPPIATQSASDRAARIAPTIQVAAHLAGAVHFANIVINVNR